MRENYLKLSLAKENSHSNVTKSLNLEAISSTYSGTQMAMSDFLWGPFISSLYWSHFFLYVVSSMWWGKGPPVIPCLYYLSLSTSVQQEFLSSNIQTLITGQNINLPCIVHILTLDSRNELIWLAIFETDFSIIAGLIKRHFMFY